MTRRTYDHRIKEQIVRVGDPNLFPELGIPRSTAVSWIRRGLGQVVSLDEEDNGERALRNRVAGLERRIAMLTAVLRLVLALLRVSGFKLELSRVAEAAGKRRLLGVIERARRCMPLSAALRVLRLSSARYHAWVRADDVCALDDRPSCPRSKPQRLTYGEGETIGDMVQSTEHRHMSIRGLALYAQRVGKVYADPGTWGKLIRERGWLRPVCVFIRPNRRSDCAPMLRTRPGTSTSRFSSCSTAPRRTFTQSSTTFPDESSRGRSRGTSTR